MNKLALVIYFYFEFILEIKLKYEINLIPHL